MKQLNIEYFYRTINSICSTTCFCIAILVLLFLVDSRSCRADNEANITSTTQITFNDAPSRLPIVSNDGTKVVYMHVSGTNSTRLLSTRLTVVGLKQM